MTTPIYERGRLHAGHTLVGPAVIVQEDSTTVIEPGYTGTIDEYANIVILETESEAR